VLDYNKGNLHVKMGNILHKKFDLTSWMSLTCIVLPDVWCKNVQHIDWSADFERWQHILYIIWPWLLNQMVAVTYRTHKLVTCSLFFTHTHPHT